jgi:hypothetical protein
MSATFIQALLLSLRMYRTLVLELYHHILAYGVDGAEDPLLLEARACSPLLMSDRALLAVWLAIVKSCCDICLILHCST